MLILLISVMETELCKANPHTPVFSLHITNTLTAIKQHTHAYLRDLQITRGISESSHLAVKMYFCVYCVYAPIIVCMCQ